MEDILTRIVLVFIIGIILVIVIKRPYYGIILTLISLPIIELLPKFPFLSSAIIPVGGATVIGALFQSKNKNQKITILFDSVQLLSLAFIFWLLISNPSAFLSTQADGRNWAVTYFQLWFLLILTPKLFSDEKKQEHFILFFAVACSISAIYSIFEGQIGSSIYTSVRAGGLSGQPNATARYLVTSVIFFEYFFSQYNKPFIKLFSLIGIIISGIAVFFTYSRTGILLLLLGIYLLFSLKKSRSLRANLVISTIFILIYFWLNSIEIFSILKSISESIITGSNTIGLRYRIWDAGWRMWLDHFFSGVGIGNYSKFLPYYSAEFENRPLVAHNTYLSILAETGFVGFIIFMGIIIISIRNFFLSFVNRGDRFTDLHITWFITFIILLVGLTTISSQYDKFLWFLCGMSIYFVQSKTHNNLIH
jgi:O-antigen ligase